MARNAMHAALDGEEPELLHEWRKQAKYHALQARLMRQQFPDALDRRVAGVRDLAELLGEVQDIEVVAAGVKRWRERPAGFLNVLDARRKSLVTGARAAGAALFSEKPKAWMKELTPPVLAGEIGSALGLLSGAIETAAGLIELALRREIDSACDELGGDADDAGR
jgi:hypothetical protein